MYQEIVMKFIVVECGCFGKPSYTTLTEHPSPPQFAPHVGDLLMHNGEQYCVIQRAWTEVHPIPHLKIYIRKT